MAILHVAFDSSGPMWASELGVLPGRPISATLQGRGLTDYLVVADGGRSGGFPVFGDAEDDEGPITEHLQYVCPDEILEVLRQECWRLGSSEAGTGEDVTAETIAAWADAEGREHLAAYLRRHAAVVGPLAGRALARLRAANGRTTVDIDRNGGSSGPVAQRLPNGFGH